MISLYQSVANLSRNLRTWARTLAHNIPWPNYHCLDEDAVMWASTFGSHTQQQSTY